MRPAYSGWNFISKFKGELIMELKREGKIQEAAEMVIMEVNDTYGA